MFALAFALLSKEEEGEDTRVGEVHALAEHVARDGCLGRRDAEVLLEGARKVGRARAVPGQQLPAVWQCVVPGLNERTCLSGALGAEMLLRSRLRSCYQALELLYIYDSVVSKFLPYKPVAPRGGNRKRCLGLPQSHLQTRGISNALYQVSEDMGSVCGCMLTSVYTGILWTQLSMSFRGKSGIDADDGLRILTLV